MLIQKSKSSNAFDEQKVKNIAIEYRLQSIFCNPGYVLTLEIFVDEASYFTAIYSMFLHPVVALVVFMTLFAQRIHATFFAQMHS